MIKFSSDKVELYENHIIGIADVLLVYTMLAPMILLIIGFHIKLIPNVFRTFVVLLGPGLLAGAIYLKFFGFQILKRSKWIILGTMLFAFIILLSSIKHIDIDSTRESLKFFIGLCLFGFCLGTISNMSIIRSRQFNTIWIVFIIGFLAYAIYQKWPVLNQRFNLAGINNAQLGMLFYFFGICVLFHIHFSKNLLTRTAVITLLLACFIIAFYSATRTTFLGFFIVFVIYLFLYSHIRLKKIYPIIFACSLIIIIFLLLTNVNKSIKARYFKGFEDAKGVIRYVLTNDSSIYNSVERIRIWEDALTNFKKNPAFGSGLGISYRDNLLDRNYVHPHNIILELLSETGILGFSVFAILFGLIFKRAFSIYRKLAIDNRMTFLFYPLSLLFFFIFSSLHTDLSTEYFKWYFSGIIAGFDIAGEVKCSSRKSTEFH